MQSLSFRVRNISSKQDHVRQSSSRQSYSPFDTIYQKKAAWEHQAVKKQQAEAPECSSSERCTGLTFGPKFKHLPAWAKSDYLTVRTNA
ncbi:MAG: hypothetical protein ACK5P7_04270 [Bdellovibrio sp.]